MKNAGMTICAILVLASTSWATAKPPKKFHTGGHPHHPLTQTGQAGHARSSGSSTVSPNSQSSREKEVQRLEHQNAMQLQAQSRQRGSKAAGQAPHMHTAPAGHGSGINYSYHPPHTQSTGTAGGRKH